MIKTKKFKARYTPKQEQFLLDNHGQYSWEELAVRFNKRYKTNKNWNALQNKYWMLTN